MAQGWIKLHRSLLKSATWQNMDVARLWVWCLLKAAYTDRVAVVGCESVPLVPGQFIFGRRVAASETGLSERKVRTSLHWLLKSENVTRRVTSKFSVITICNWERYQGDEEAGDPQSDQQAASKRPANDHIEEVKEREERKEGESPDGDNGRPCVSHVTRAGKSKEAIVETLARLRREGKIPYRE